MLPDNRIPPSDAYRRIMKRYPINLDIRNRRCLIVGGGEVAARKIDGLVTCGARVLVISPEVIPAIEQIAVEGRIEWQRRSYRSGDMDGAFLVFAATDNKAVQRDVVAEAQSKSILVNRVDDPGACSFQVPALVRRGKFLLTVSTGGGSPALSAKLRRILEKEFGDEYQQLVDLMASIRKKITADGNPQKSHKDLFEKLLQRDIISQIRQEDWATLQEELSAILPEDIDVSDLIASIQPGPRTHPEDSEAGSPDPTPTDRTNNDI